MTIIVINSVDEGIQRMVAHERIVWMGQTLVLKVRFRV